MTISYAPFLTPFASPAMGRIDVSPLQEVGANLSNQVRLEQERKDRLMEQQRRFELDKSDSASRNDYYSAQAQTHRMQVEQSKKMDAEKRARALFDAFRKAKTPVERQAIRDELARNGFKVDEEDTDLPEAPGTAVASTAPAAPQALSKEAAAAKLTPTIKGAAVSGLSGLLGLGPSESPAEGVASDSVTMKGPLAGPEMGVVPPEVTKPKRGGKFTIRDASGVQVSSYDEPVERMKSQSAIRGALGSMGLAAVTDREKAATQAATEAGAQMLDLGLQPVEAVKFAVDIYGKTLNNAAYKKQLSPDAPKGGGGGGIPTKIGIKLNDQALNAYNMVADNINQQQSVKASFERKQFAQSALEKLQAAEQGGLTEHAALKDYLFSVSGKVVTDNEMDKLLGSAGAWEKWKFQAAQYLDGGRMPDDFKRQLRGLMETISRGADAVLDDAGKSAHDQLFNLPLGLEPDDQKALAETLGSSFSSKFKARRNRTGAPARAGAPAKSNIDAQLDDLLK